MTKIEKMEMVLALVNATECADKEVMVEFLEHEIELLANRKSGNSKAKEKQKQENLGLAEKLLEVMIEIGKPATITEIKNFESEISDLSAPKITSLMGLLIDNKKVARTVEKKRPYFSVIEN